MRNRIWSKFPIVLTAWVVVVVIALPVGVSTILVPIASAQPLHFLQKVALIVMAIARSRSLLKSTMHVPI